MACYFGLLLLDNKDLKKSFSSENNLWYFVIFIKFILQFYNFKFFYLLSLLSGREVKTSNLFEFNNFFLLH